eukprot:6930600-Prymnesium_polylepis.1
MIQSQQRERESSTAHGPQLSVSSRMPGCQSATLVSGQPVAPPQKSDGGCADTSHTHSAR